MFDQPLNGRALSAFAAIGVLAASCGGAEVAPDAGADGGAGGGGRAALASYLRGERLIESPDPDVVFGAEIDAKCEAMPEQAPEGAFVMMWERGREPESWREFGVTARRPCRFDWTLLHIDHPPSACAVVTKASFDALWAELRRVRFTEIPTRTLDDVSPHRGGYGLLVRWPGARCEVSDVLFSEVVPSSEDAFLRARRAFVDAFQKKIAR